MENRPPVLGVRDAACRAARLWENERSVFVPCKAKGVTVAVDLLDDPVKFLAGSRSRAVVVFVGFSGKMTRDELGVDRGLKDTVQKGESLAENAAVLIIRIFVAAVAEVAKAVADELAFVDTHGL